MDTEVMKTKLRDVVDTLREISDQLDDSTHGCSHCGLPRRNHPIEFLAKQALEAAETRVVKVLEKLLSGEWKDRDDVAIDDLSTPASVRREEP